jgi:hypothetical protein
MADKLVTTTAGEGKCVKRYNFLKTEIGKIPFLDKNFIGYSAWVGNGKIRGIKREKIEGCGEILIKNFMSTEDILRKRNFNYSDEEQKQLDTAFACNFAKFVSPNFCGKEMLICNGVVLSIGFPELHMDFEDYIGKEIYNNLTGVVFVS